MKKLLLLFVMIMMAMTVMAQTTEKITYQAVVRDRTNRLVVYTPVRVDVTITYSSGSYFESLRDTTNANGLMYVLIGGNPGFENINWERAVIKTVITIEGGETVSDEVVVTAVPIALQANYATNVSPTAPTIVAVYNQMQADSLALANQIAAERAHLDDTLSHYLMQEVQVLSISNDTIYLTGGSFVKLPAGFSGNYNDLTNKPNLDQYATNVHLNDTLGHYLMQEVQVLSVSNDTLFLTGGSWVKLPQGFSGNYNDLTNLPDLNQYATNVHLNDTLSHYLMQEVQVLSVSNDTLYLTGGSWVKLPQGFSGNYNDLTNLPDLNQYATNVHLNDTLKNYLTINGLCDSIKNCEAITNLQTVDSLLGVQITRDSIVLSGKIYSDSVYLKGLIDSIKVNVTNNTTNITNNTTNISNITNYVTSLQVADSVLNDRFTRDSIALSNRLDTMFAHICDSIEQCEVITNLQTADSLLGVRITRDSVLFYKADSILANRITRDSILFYMADSILADRITRDSILSYKADSILSARITADSINLVNNYYDKIKINDTVAYILSQITTASGNLNDNYYTKVEINDTLSHYTTSDRIDSLLGDYVKKDTLENYLTIAGLCDSIKNCDVIANLQTADSLLGIRITRDSILSYKADSILADRITRDSVLFYKTDSILANRITRDSILSYKADSILAVRITRDSVLFYKADSVLSARITADSINLVNNYYDKIKINDTVAYILSQITTASGNLNDNYYTKVEINDTLSHYTTSDRIDSLLGDYVKKDTLENYLTIAGLCDSIKNCEVITNLQTADSLLGVRITRDSILSYKADSVLSVHMINDSILFHKTDSVLLVHILNDSILSYQADSILLARILNDSILSYKADSILAAHILMDSVVSFRSDSILSVRISADSANLANNYYTKVEINDTLSHYTTTDRIDSLLGDYVKKDTLENYLTIAGLCDSIKNCEAITNLQAADSLLGVRITRDSILFYKADSVLSVHMINDSILFHKTDSVLLVHILNDSILSYQADSILLARILNDSILSYKADSILAAHILMDSVVSFRSDSILSVRISTDSANLANNYYTKVEINDTLSHYTTSDNIDSLLGDFVKKDTLENYLTIAGLCDSIKNCEVITNLQAADSLLGVRIIRDSILSYKADSILADRITRDSILFYKADSILAVRITRDSILFYKADSILSMRITADSISLVNNYYDKIKINDTVAYILSQITTASGNLNDNYYTKVEINDTLSHYTTSDRIDTLLGDYVKKDTLENYLTIAGLCDSIKNCEAITNLQAADSLLGVRITRDSILSYKADSILANRITRDSILSYKADSILANRITRDSVLFYKADSILANRITRDSILSYKADSILANRITRDSILFYNADSVLSARITADSINLVNNYYDKIKINDTVAYILSQITSATGNLNDNYYTKIEINDTLSHYTTSDNIDSLLGDFVKKDTLENYLTIAGLCDSIKNCDVIANMATGITTNTTNISNNTTNITNNTTNITNLQIADSVLNARFTKDSTALAHRMDTLLKHVCDSVKPCVTEWMNDTLKAYTTTNKIDTLLGAYATNAHLNDTLSWYTTTNKIDTLIQKYGYTTIAHLNDTLRQYTTSDYVDTLLTAYEKKADLCKDVMGCIGDTLSKYTTSNKIDTLLGAYATNAHLNDTLSHYYDTALLKKAIHDTANVLRGQIPVVNNGQITIKVNNQGTEEVTTFGVNQAGDELITITIPAEVAVNNGQLTIIAKGDTTRFTANQAINDTVNLSGYATIALLNDTLNAYTTTNKIDTLLGAYATNAHLNDTLSWYTTTNKIDTLIQKYGYATTAHLNDTLSHYTTSDHVDTLLNAYEKKADLCKDVMGCIGDTLSKYTTTNNIDTLIQKYGYTTIAHLNDTLRRYTTTNQIDTLIRKYGYLTSDSTVIVTMRDSIQKVNNRLTYDSTALAHRMDTLLKHVCDSVKPCVTGWMNDTLKAYTTSNKIDTLLGAYVTNAHLNDTLKVYTTTNKIDTLIQKYGYTTTAHLNDTLKKYTTSNQVDTLLTAYEKRADLCKDVMGCIGDTLSKYTTTNQIDTLIKKYGYLTSDSSVIVRMRDSIQKVNNRLTYDSTALAHRMDTLLKHVCDSVKPCVTGWMNDTLKAYTTSNKIDTLLGAYVTNAHLNDTLKVYTTTNKIDTLIQKYGYTTTAHLNDTLKKYTTSNQVDTLLNAYEKRADLCKDVMGCIGDTLSKYTTTNQIDTLIKKYGYLTSDSAVIVRMRDSIQKVNNRLTYDSTALAHRMDTLLKHVCDSVKPCVTGWMNDTLKVYTTTNKIDTLIQKYGYTTTAHLNDTLRKYTTSDHVDTLLNAYEKRADLCKDVMGCIGDTLSKYTTTNKIDTLIRKYGYLTSDSAVIVRMRDSIQKVNNRLTYDSTALAHRMDTLLKHVCDSVKPCVTGWMNDTLKAYTTSNKIDTLLGAYVTNAHLNDTLKVYTTTNKIDTLIQKYGYTTTAHLNDTLKKYTTSNQVDTLLTAYEKRADLCKDVMGCIGDTLSKYTTTNQIDTLIKKYGYLTSDSSVIVRMRDSIQKVNNRLTYDSTALAHRMDTLLKHVCDSVKPCVTGWISDSTRMVFDSLHRYYTSLSTLADSMHRVDVRIKHDSLEVVELYKQAQTALQTLALIEKTDSLTLAHRMDTLLKHVCDSVQPCVTGWIKDSTRMVFDTLHRYYTTLNTLKDSTKNIRSALVDTAHNIRNSIGNGKLTIKQGEVELGSFKANQNDDKSIIIPVPTAPNDATLTIQKNGTTVGTFTANQAADNTINITVPTCDTLANCDLIKEILARLDKLERQNDSLAKEIEKFKPTLTVAASDESVTVCSGSILPVTYTATFHNCSSSDYTIAWKVNGTDSSNVTGATLVFNAETAGEYKVVCVATRPGYVTVTDTVTTTVTVDEAIPSFTASVTNLTVTLTDVVNTATIQWDTDSLPVAFSGTSATHIYSVADTITITATNEGGCTFIKGLRLQATAPVVTTDSVPASTIAATTAKAYGTVTSDGGIPETKRGILYSITNSEPEFGANGVDSVMNGTGKGNYACTLERLVPCTKYYVRAFAYNEVDTVYGVVKDFTTPSFTCGSTLYDIDGNNYGTLLLGSQCWMKQNLRTTRFADGTEIPKGSISLSSATLPYYYEPDSNIATYGRLYNWTAAMHGSPSSLANPSDVQGVCPDGWHLPSDTEWTQLTSFVASNSENVCGNNPAYIAKALASNEGWEYFDTSSVSVECYLVTDVATNNKTQFSVLPTGTWEVGSKAGYTNYGHSIYRTATEYEQIQYQSAYARQFYGDQPFVERTAPIKEVGYSVRCVLDCAADTFPPTVSAVKITNTGDSTVSMAAIVLSDGGAEVTARGVCWSTSQHPTTSNFIASSGAGTGDFSVTGNLKLGTTYYVRAYATNSKGTAYGAEVIFNMPNVPTVTTAEASVVNATDATIGGNVTADGGMPVTVRGMCWSTSPEPTIGNGNDTTMNGTGLGSFEASLKNLTSSTTYHVRAYATNDVGTAYGEDVSFTTASLIPPTVTTGAVNLNVTIANVITVTATCEGDVTDEGTDTVTARGVCWSISQNPTVNDSLTTDDGSGTGSFTCNITGFNASTTYYVRAYATNSAGTAYGNQVVFTPKVDKKSCVAAPTVTDHEGNVYATVQIGSQCWMRENLRTTTSPKTGTYLVKPDKNSNNEKYSSNGSKVAYWFSNDSTTYAPKGYGLLYNWCAAMDTANSTNYMEVPTSSDIDGNNTTFQFIFTDPYRGICPVGWHIPSYNELNDSIIMKYKGGMLAGGNDWYDNSSTSTTNTSPGNYSYGDRNSTGFTAFPAAVFSGNSFQNGGGMETHFWSTWQMNSGAAARSMKLSYSDNSPVLQTRDKNQALSVRCVRDAVSVSTAAATGIGQTSATLNGSISNPDNVAISSQGFEWKATGGSYTQVSASVTTPGYELSGLQPNTSYTFRAFATTSSYGTFYGEEQSFTTEATEFTVTTSSATDVAYTSATLNGSIVNPALANVTVNSKGFEWKKTSDDDESYEQVLVEGATLSYNITGLTQNTSYTFRAFASLASGSTVYGSTETFTTLTHLIDLSLLTSNYVANDQDTLIKSLDGYYKISIADGAAVTLRNATIDFGTDGNYEFAGITCEGDATIKLEGVNVVKVDNGNPGIYVATGKTLTIDGQDSLFVCSNGNGAGIGGGLDKSCGNIVIEGGKIEARGGQYAAGIGSGVANNSSITCGSITINGGKVTAIGGHSGAGIGTGCTYNTNNTCDIININGGAIKATAGQYAAGIGTGRGWIGINTCGDISISDGIVVATGNQGSAGIGTGLSYNTCLCGNISILGGEVKSKALQMAAGIGSGLATDRYAAYVDHPQSICGNITILGGTVEAEGGTSNDGFEGLSFVGGAGIGTGSGGTYNNVVFSSTCGSVTIGSDVTRVTATKGDANVVNSIGKNHSSNPGTCGTVTIGTEVGPISTSPYTYPTQQ